MFSRIKGALKEGFARINEGGVALTSEWSPDTKLRDLAHDPHIKDVPFLDDLRVLHNAISDFNATRPEKMRFNVVVREGAADTLLSLASSGVTDRACYRIGGSVGLERNGRLYEGHYFSGFESHDFAYKFASGFAFKQQGVETKFYSSLNGRHSKFDVFADILLNPSVMHGRGGPIHRPV